MNKSVLIQPNFFYEAKRLRKHFDQTFENPHSAQPERFVWDYWHVPNQYTTLRTPAYHFFPKKIYESLHNELVWWGRSVLGCHDISPPWMSCYVDGCYQDLHGDLPHGPWAFVFSITDWAHRKFQGGETVLVRDEILNYWSDFKSVRRVEHEDIFDKIPAKFNQLTVFDPRIPHGVSKVSGVQNVCEGRIVIHGWFVQPRPFIQGSLKEIELADFIQFISEQLNELFDSGVAVQGLLSARITVNKDGSMNKPIVLSNSLQTLNVGSADQDQRQVIRLLNLCSRAYTFKKQKSTSTFTLPLVFENS